jgi:hypothetical protein
MQRRLTALGGGIAIVAVVAVGVALLLDPRFGLGQPRPSGTLLPIGLVDEDVPVEPGWYFVEVEGYRYSFHIPTSGFVSTPSRNLLTGSQNVDVPGYGALAFLGNPSFVYADPCHWKGTESTTGKTAADFVAALAAVSEINPLLLSDVRMDGRDSKHIRIGVQDVDFFACDELEYRSYENRRYRSAWQVDDLYAIDFENGDRSVVLVSYTSGSPPYIWEILQYVVHSVRIEAITP